MIAEVKDHLWVYNMKDECDTNNVQCLTDHRLEDIHHLMLYHYG